MEGRKGESRDRREYVRPTESQASVGGMHTEV
jgi:hypothetical protein